ncbi:hypothetical protein SNS2_0079 [Streptomyces netropsis]|uniref:Acetyl esterase/lipase n=1 Tax=Streptomyces syringium TaxID=76729 RepID=A0ABS4XYH2_9ACTN|nr:hypothetical protein [Streptomyces syringium]MBP2401551.1 acetyl esterase/lipase [Streptomyces syringium]SPE47674.1 hypothetical protein SNS2_0079 [Streptomyces netropsis]
MDPELEAFIPFLPDLDLNDPVTARKHVAEHAAAVPAPDTSAMEVEDRTVPADPDVAMPIYARRWGRLRRPGHRAPGGPPTFPACHRPTSPPPSSVRTATNAYALRLLQAGVSVELHQWPGTFHGSQAIQSAAVSQRQITDLAAALRRAPV